MRQLANFLRCPQSEPITIIEDNVASIFLSKREPKYSNKSKHTQWRYYYAMQTIQEKTVLPVYISTTEQTADILTEWVASNSQFYYLRPKIMNCENTKSGL